MSINELRRTLSLELEAIQAERRLLDERIADKARQLALVDEIEALSKQAPVEVTSEPEVRPELTVEPDLTVEPERSAERGPSVRQVTWTGDSAKERELLLRSPIGYLGFSPLVLNMLENSGHRTLQDVAETTLRRFFRSPSFRPRMFEEISRVLSAYQLSVQTEFVRYGDGTLVENFSGPPKEPDARTAESPVERPEAVRRDNVEVPTVQSQVSTALRSCINESIARTLEIVERQHRKSELPGFDDLLAFANSPIDVAMASTRYNRHEIVAYFEGLIGLAARVAQGRNVSPLDEVALAMAHLDPFDRQVSVEHLGLAGKPAQTMEQVAAAHQTTRQIVKASVDRIVAMMEAVRPSLPFTTAMTTSLQSGRVYSLQDWQESLPAGIQPADQRELLAVQTAGDWGWLPRLAWRDIGSSLLLMSREIDAGRLDHIVLQCDRIIRPYREFGALSLHDAATRADAPIGVVRAVVRGNATWVEAEDDWFIPSIAASTEIGRTARHVLRLLGPLPIADLHTSLQRGRRSSRAESLRPFPPLSVFRRLLQGASCVVDWSSDVASAESTEPEVVWSAAEGAVIAAFENGRTAVTGPEFVDSLRRFDVPASEAYPITFASPLLKQVSYGILSKLGSDPTTAEAEDARRRLVVHAMSCKVDEHSEGETIVARFRVDMDAPLLLFPIDRPISDAREWKARGQDGTSRTLWSRQGILERGAVFARRALGAGSEHVALRLNPIERSIEISW